MIIVFVRGLPQSNKIGYNRLLPNLHILSIVVSLSGINPTELSQVAVQSVWHVTPVLWGLSASL